MSTIIIITPPPPPPPPEEEQRSSREIIETPPRRRSADCWVEVFGPLPPREAVVDAFRTLLARYPQE